MLVKDGEVKMKIVICPKCGEMRTYIERSLEHWERTIDPNNETNAIADPDVIYTTKKRCPYCNRVVTIEDRQLPKKDRR